MTTRNVFFLALVALGLLQIYQFVELTDLKARNAAAASTINELKSALQRTNDAMKGLSKPTSNDVETKDEDNAPPAEAPVRKEDLNDASYVTAQLALTLSIKVDYLVDWVDLIEDKIFYLVLQPPQPAERERIFGQLRQRTDDIRAKFTQVSQSLHEMRRVLFDALEKQGRPATRPPLPERARP